MDSLPGSHGLPRMVPPPPSDDVLAWRRAQLLAAGFDAWTAARLAEDHDVDLHEVLNLVDRGCPPTLAARIMDSRLGSHG